MNADQLQKILQKHAKWLYDEGGGQRASLCGADLRGANLRGAILCVADLRGANLRGAILCVANLREADLREANLREANLREADLGGADLRGANLSKADLREADLREADLGEADLREADLGEADLRGANLSKADLREADLGEADLREADLGEADLTDCRGLVKLMGVAPGNYYWKRFAPGLCNGGYQYHVGLNCLRPGEEFAADERLICSFPGFHFASRSWCAANYPERPLEALIRIPEDARINEPWATDGKASADRIEIVQVFDVETGEDVTSRFLPCEEEVAG